jgi:crossover junction endodeoxyribonuclease RuvC
LIGGSAARPAIIDCGIIRLGRHAFAERLHRLYRQLDDVVERLQPTACAVEAPFHGASARSSLQLAHARGVILAVLAGRGLDVAEYTPAEVKKAVTGNGRAEKLQVGRMVQSVLGSRTQREPSDVTDALAVGLCHMANGRFAAAVSRARSRSARPRG